MDKNQHSHRFGCKPMTHLFRAHVGQCAFALRSLHDAPIPVCYWRNQPKVSNLYTVVIREQNIVRLKHKTVSLSQLDNHWKEMAKMAFLLKMAPLTITFKSLWMSPFEWIYSTPQTTCWNTWRASSLVFCDLPKFLSSNQLESVPFSQNSIWMNRQDPPSL